VSKELNLQPPKYVDVLTIQKLHTLEHIGGSEKSAKGNQIKFLFTIKLSQLT
jgi:hypothetical protein